MLCHALERQPPALSPSYINLALATAGNNAHCVSDILVVSARAANAFLPTTPEEDSREPGSPEIVISRGPGPAVEQASLGEQQHVIKHGADIAAGLVNGAHHLQHTPFNPISSLLTDVCQTRISRMLHAQELLQCQRS